MKEGGGVLGVKSVAVWVAEGGAGKVPRVQGPQSRHSSNNRSTNGSSKSSNRRSERTR